MANPGPPEWQQPPQYGEPGHPPPNPVPPNPVPPNPLPPGSSPYGYPAPPAPAVYGYPSPEALAARMSPMWTGLLLTAAGLLVAIGSFLTWETILATLGGPAQTIDIAGTSGQRDGKITVFVVALMLAMGLLIVVRQGRLWVSIAGVVLSAVAAVVAVAEIRDVNSTGKTVSSIGAGHVDVGPGLYVVLAAAAVGLAASITALCVRRGIQT